MAENEDSPGRQPSSQAGSTPPVLVEFVIMLSVVLTVLVFFTVLGISLLTGASLAALVFRTSISILVIGGLMALIARQVSSGMTTVQERTVPQPGAEPVESEAPASPEAA